MKRLFGYRKIKDNLNDPVIAIGMFDGIHLGHKRVIKRVMTLAGKNRDAAVVTFDPHPQAVLRPKEGPPRIMSLEHRMHIFEKMGLDAVIVINFTEHLSAMTPEDFIKQVIVSGIGAKKVFVGGNFHFGRAKSGDISSLKDIAKKYDVDVSIVQPVKQAGKIISSTWLRKLISSGKILRAEKLLRRPPSVWGTVVKGDQRGRELGIPTANIDPHQEVIPPPGVYAVKADIDDVLYDGVLNVGFKPTFYGNKLKKRKEPYIEAHILEYTGDLYGKSLEIFFIKRLRGEKKFRSVTSLVRQVDKDVKKAYDILESKAILNKIRKYKDI